MSIAAPFIGVPVRQPTVIASVRIVGSGLSDTNQGQRALCFLLLPFGLQDGPSLLVGVEARGSDDDVQDSTSLTVYLVSMGIDL